MFRTLFTKFRGGLLQLECNVGRSNNIPFQERLCPLCHSDVETEFHFLPVCPDLVPVRTKYFFCHLVYISINGQVCSVM